MARIRNIVMEGATGRLGSMVLTQRAGTGTVARTLAPEVSNPKSDAQQTRRVKWANLVNFYKVSKGWMAKAFENKAANQSDYNKFMSLNANTTMVALTKDQASQGGVIAGPYTISQGSLPSIEITRLVGGSYATSLGLGSLTISASTTVADFSTALLGANSLLKEGMQLSFISYQQQRNGVTGVPYCICGWYEVTLNTSDSRLLDSVMPTSFAAATVQNSGNYLGTGPALSGGAFAYILSDRKSGKINVSTQQLVVYNNPEYETAITQTALNAAIESYGKGTDVFLAPGYTGDSQSQEGVNSVSRVIIGQTLYTPGVNVLSCSSVIQAGEKLEIEMSSSLGDLTVTQLTAYIDVNFSRREAVNPTVSGNKITVSNWNTTWTGLNDTRKVTSITIVLSNGKTFNVEFPTETVID